jgi:hypothetical protein
MNRDEMNPSENNAAAQETPQTPVPPPAPAAYGPAVYGSGAYKPKAAKEPYGFARPDGAFALLTTVLSFLFIKFVLAGGGGVSVTVYTVLYSLTLLFYMRVRKVDIRPASVAYLAVMLVTGAYFGLHGGGPLSVFTLLFLIALSAYTVTVFCASRTQNSLQYVVSDTCTALFVTPFSHFGAGLAAVRNSTRGKTSLRVLYAALGVILAIPLFIFVGSLLGSADELFQRMWDALVESIFSRIHIHAAQYVFGLPIAMYLFGLFYGSLRRRAQPRATERAEARVRSLRILPLPLAMGIVVPLLLLYTLFFISQIPYLTSAFQGMTPEGITQAEYARRGFFELCWVCSINMAVLLGLYYFTKTGESKSDDVNAGKPPAENGGFFASCRPAGICAILLCLFSMALSVMSLSKMLLYIQTLGMTQKRIYTSFFMVFLFAAFGLAIAGLLRKRFATAKWVTLTGTALLLILCFINADGLIARHNISRYQLNKVEKLDVMPLRALGDAAVRPLAELLDAGGLDPALEDDILYVLSSIYYENHLNRERNWRSMTLTSQRSLAVLEGMSDRLDYYGQNLRPAGSSERLPNEP